MSSIGPCRASGLGHSLFVHSSSFANSNLTFHQGLRALLLLLLLLLEAACLM
jgi:hypothetical protein